MMRLSIVALLLAMAVVSPGATAPALGDREKLYACGESCAAAQLACAWEVKPAPVGITLKALIDEDMLPWGQMDYWVAGGVVADRQGAEQIVDGKRVAGPEIVSFGGSDWVRADYDIDTTDGDGVSASVLIWPAEGGIALLRCSFRAGADGERRAEELALGMRR